MSNVATSRGTCKIGLDQVSNYKDIQALVMPCSSRLSASYVGYVVVASDPALMIQVSIFLDL